MQDGEGRTQVPLHRTKNGEARMQTSLQRTQTVYAECRFPFIECRTVKAECRFPFTERRTMKAEWKDFSTVQSGRAARRTYVEPSCHCETAGQGAGRWRCSFLATGTSNGNLLRRPFCLARAFANK